MPQKTAGEILDAVKAVLEGREKNYDNPKDNFDRIAAYWTVRLGEKLQPGQAVTAQDVSDLMILMKVAREQFRHTEDNYLDIIGYGVCGLRVAEQVADDGATITASSIAELMEASHV